MRWNFADYYEPCPTTGCYLWLGKLNSSGYASKYFGGKMELAHRIAWILENGAIPHGMQVLHRCDVRSCVNPDHLFLGTQRDNLRDAIRKGRAPQMDKQTVCKKGHPMQGNNLCLETGGIRRCLECRLKSRRAYRERKEHRV